MTVVFKVLLPFHFAADVAFRFALLDSFALVVLFLTARDCDFHLDFSPLIVH